MERRSGKLKNTAMLMLAFDMMCASIGANKISRVVVFEQFVQQYVWYQQE
jgi:hypothetical protein